MMPFEKPEKNMIFTEQKEPKRDFSNVTFLKILLVEKLSFQNLTRCENFTSKADAFFLNSKSDTLYSFFLKNWQDQKSYSKTDAWWSLWSKADFLIVFRF